MIIMLLVFYKTIQLIYKDTTMTSLEELIRYLVELSIEDCEPMTKDSIKTYFLDIVESNYESEFISKETFDQYIAWSNHF